MDKPGIDASPDLMEIIFSAIDIGVEYVQLSAGSPFIPFTLTLAAGKRQLNKFLVPADEHSEIGFNTPLNIEQGVRLAMASIAALPPDVESYVVAYDGYVTLNDRKTDAIMIHASERRTGFGLLFAQRYRPGIDDRPFESIGNPAYLGKEESLW